MFPFPICVSDMRLAEALIFSIHRAFAVRVNGTGTNSLTTLPILASLRRTTSSKPAEATTWPAD